MHNLESVLENETHKILWNFEIQTDHLFPARRPDLVIGNKKNKLKSACRIVDIAVVTNHRINLKESEKWDKYQPFSREQKKKKWNMNMVVIAIQNVLLEPFTKEWQRD